jgi:hypothetical protein
MQQSCDSRLTQRFKHVLFVRIVGSDKYTIRTPCGRSLAKSAKSGETCQRLPLCIIWKTDRGCLAISQP